MVASPILDQPTLVLNRNWQPVQVTPVRRALVLVCSGVARVVEPQTFQVFDWEQWLETNGDGERRLRTPRLLVRIPEVVALAEFDRVPSAKVSFSKRNIFRRDHFTCQYCGNQPGKEELSIDHVTPRARGGESSWENCVLACVDCNHRKADRTLEQVGMRLRRKPSRPLWHPVESSAFGVRGSWAPFLPKSAAERAAS